MPASRRLLILGLCLLGVSLWLPAVAAQDALPEAPANGKCNNIQRQERADQPVKLSFNNVGNVDLYAWWFDAAGAPSERMVLPSRATTGPFDTFTRTPWVVTDAKGDCVKSVILTSPLDETVEVGTVDNAVKRVLGPIVTNPLIMIPLTIFILGSLMGWKYSDAIAKRKIQEGGGREGGPKDFHTDKHYVGERGYFRQRKE